MVFNGDKLYTSTDGNSWDNQINSLSLFIDYIAQMPDSAGIGCDPPCEAPQTCDQTTGKCIGGDDPADNAGGISWIWIGIIVSILSLLVIIYVNVMKREKGKIKVKTHKSIDIHLV